MWSNAKKKACELAACKKYYKNWFTCSPCQFNLLFHIVTGE
nr:MAG TPA: hypothetical protein [Caudoviricetes sp.]DAS83193.1 MAG TPA: hypothetical protein [Caudoviricetes sp.]DAU82296.1 MAG TPA: hypothetical protein [Caudoviricetes sp.]